MERSASRPQNALGDVHFHVHFHGDPVANGFLMRIANAIELLATQGGTDEEIAERVRAVTAAFRANTATLKDKADASRVP